MFRSMKMCGLLLALCAFTALGAGGGATGNATAPGGHDEDEEHAHGPGHEWWTELYEVFHLEETVIVVIVGITLMVDGLQHWMAHLTRSRRFWSDDKEDELEAVTEHSSREPLMFLLFTRGTAEFTVLGIIACIVWICNRTASFDMIAEMLHEADEEGMLGDVTLPNDGYGYYHTVESVHMHLFVTFVMYFATMAGGIGFASNWMKKWADDKDMYEREIRNFRCGKDCSEQFDEAKWTKEFLTLRKTFLTQLTHHRTSSEHMDKKLQMVLKPKGAPEVLPGHLPVDLPGIDAFMTEKFPFTVYVVENFRDMLEHMVEIHLSSLGVLAICQGIQALLHRFKVKFDLAYMWIGIWCLVVLGFNIYVWRFHHRLAKGDYLKGNLAESEKFVRTTKLPKRLCSVIQIASLFCCFEMTRPIAHSYVWRLSRPRSITHCVLCVLWMPLAGWVLGVLLAKMSVVLSCGTPAQPANEARIRLIWKRHLLAKLVDLTYPSAAGGEGRTNSL